MELWIIFGRSAGDRELIIVDGDAKELQHVRTVKRVPVEQRWNPDHLQWVTMVPWNRGGGDDAADGDLPDFDVKKGPGRQLTEEEKQDITTSEAPKITHKAHFRRADFDKHGYTDRCAGCSALLRGLHAQPHSRECRARMEKALGSDIRIKNAKARTQEKATKMRKEKGEDKDDVKRRKLEEIENQAMQEEDPDKLADLFEKYRTEYIKERDVDEGSMKRRKVETLEDLEGKAMMEEDPEDAAKLFERYKEQYLRERGTPGTDEKRRKTDNHIEAEMSERASSSADPVVYEEMEVGNVMADTGDFTEETVVEMTACWIEGAGQRAWDDVNDMALPLDLVRKARKEEMSHTRGRSSRSSKGPRRGRSPGRHL